MSPYQVLSNELSSEPKRWLVTGGAGFIGSNLVETLLGLNQSVTVLDNFSTGRRDNLDDLKAEVSSEQWGRLNIIEGDIRSLDDCRRACSGADYVLHQAALGSVPRSIDNPILTNENNVSGFLNMLVAARDEAVRRFVYAASSSTYGDHPALPKVEENIGNPLSPYAVTKYVNEIYADVFQRVYGFETVGLRYFNVFGKRQDPNGAYAAVVPKWTAAMIQNQPVVINGDGLTSRDFCYIANAVQANILAAATHNPSSANNIYNVAVGDRTTLLELFEAIRLELLPAYPHLGDFSPTFREFRVGDVRHSLADISKAERLLGYQPTHRVREGLAEAMAWYVNALAG